MLMECTRYAAGMYLGEKDVEKVISKVRKKYPHASMSELEAMAIDAMVRHNQATSMNSKLGGRLMYYRGDVGYAAGIKSLEVTNKGVQVELDNGESFHFVEDTYGEMWSGDYRSDDMTNVWHSTPRSGNSLHNIEASEETVEKVFSGVELDSGTVDNIMSKMAELDQNATNSDWDAEHSNYLRDVVKEFVDAGVNAGGMEVKVTKNIVKALREPLAEYNPNKPAGSKIRIATADISEQVRNRLIMSNQEALTHEVTHAVLDFALDNNLDVVGQDIKTDIRKLYRQAKEQLTYEDLLPENPTNAEVEKAKEMYAYIFEGKLDNNTVADAQRRLKEFLAYGTTNKHFKKAIDGLPLATKKMEITKYDSWVERTVKTIINAVQKFVATLNHKKNRADTVGEELTRLTYKLVSTQQKYATKAKQNTRKPINEKISEEVSKQIDKIDAHVKDGVETALEKIGLGKDSKYTDKDIEDKILELDKLTEAFKKGSWMKKTMLVPQIIATTKLIMVEADKHNVRPDIYAAWSRTLSYMDNTGFQFIKDLAADFSAGRKTLEQVTDMAMQVKTHLDRYREANYIGTLKDVYSAFAKVNLNKRANRKYAIALNKVVLRGDLQAVTTSSRELKRLLTDEQYAAAKIAKLEGEINQLEYDGELGPANVGQDMVDKTKELAKYIVTGKGLRTNAENIARNFGTWNAVGYEVNAIPDYSIAAVAKQVDKLASLYALQLVDEQHKADMVELIDKDKDGVNKYLEIAKGAQYATYEDWLLSGNAQDRAKGQLHEKTNGDSDIQYAPLADARKMKELGYRLIRKINTDTSDKIDTVYGMYVSNEVGLTKRVDGTLGLQRVKVPGLLLSEKVRLEYEGLSPANLAKKVREAIVESTKVGKHDEMTPVYNDQGMIIDYKYEYTIDDKEKYLDMEQRGTELLARAFGQKGTQFRTDADNRTLIDILYKDYDKLDTSGKWDKDTRHLYVKVEAVNRGHLTKKEKASGKIFSDDNVYTARTQGEELWGLLPPDARKYIIKKNRQMDLAKLAKKKKVKVSELTEADIIEAGIEDRKEIYIRKDMIKQVFGYDEMSIADSKLFKHLPEPYKRKIRLAGRLWANFIEVAKTSVVVKLPRTVVGNILSNAKFMYYGGIPFKKSVELLLLSKKSLDKWKEDEALARKLERQIDSVEGSKKAKLEKRLADVRAEMNDNPLKPLMDEGMYQTIVEDVALDDSNNKIVNWAEDKLDALVGDKKVVEELIHTVVLSRKSTLGQIALAVTAESDLHFRAATYWYGKEQINNDKKLSSKEKKEKMDKLMRDVRDNFINYSKVINSRFIQWLDRVGMEPFWKYFANIQRVNLKLARTRATRVVGDMTAEKMLDIPAGTLDSSIVLRWGKRLNPTNWFNNVEGLVEGATEVPLVNVIEGW